jgi:hypothetical protein
MLKSDYTVEVPGKTVAMPGLLQRLGVELFASSTLEFSEHLLHQSAYASTPSEAETTRLLQYCLIKLPRCNLGEVPRNYGPKLVRRNAVT